MKYIKYLAFTCLAGMIFSLSACSGKMSVETNSPPAVEIYTPAGMQSGATPLVFDLFDAEDSPCTLSVMYSGGSAGDTWTQATLKESIVWIKPGEDLVLTWLSDLDEPNRVASDYRLRIIPNDGQIDGAAAKTAFIQVNNTTDGTLLWKCRTLNKVKTSPALSGTTLYTAEESMGYFDMIDTRTGELTGTFPPSPFFPAVSPVLDASGNAYVMDINSNLYCLGPDGTENWSVSFTEPWTKSPTLDGNALYMVIDKFLYSLSTADGHENWSKNYGASLTSPAIFSSGNIVFSSGNSYYSLSAGGSQRFSAMPFGAIIPGTGTGMSIGPDGNFYYVDSNGTLNACAESNGSVIWHLTLGGQCSEPPAISPDGTIYIGTIGRQLLAVDPVSKSIKWSFRAGGDIQCVPAVAADGTVIFSSTDGMVYALNSDGSLQWSFDGLFSITSSPLIGPDGTVYIGSDAYFVYAIRDENGGPATSGWPMYNHDARHTGKATQ